MSTAGLAFFCRQKNQDILLTPVQLITRNFMVSVICLGHGILITASRIFNVPLFSLLHIQITSWLWDFLFIFLIYSVLKSFHQQGGMVLV